MTHTSPCPFIQIGPTNLNAFQFGRSYGSSTAALSSPLKSTRPSSSYSNFGVCYGLTNSAVPRQPSLSGSRKILLENDRPPLIHRSSIDRSSTGATDYASPFSSISSGRYPSSTLSSRDSDSKIPLNNSTRLSCTTESCKKGQKENEERQEGIFDRYVIVISRGCSTEEVLGLNHKLTGISATKTETMEQSLGKKSSFTNSTQTSDDILLPLAKNSVNSPSGSKIGTPRRLNIGGRYLNHLHRQDSTEPQSPQPSRGGWRESVYGVDYAAKSRAQTQPPTSPQPQQGLSLAEQRKLERERMLEEEWKNQLQLEIEREKRRLRQLERKARWEKDEAKNRELEEEIKRRRQAAAELAERESNLRRGEDQRMRESRPSPSQITTQIGFSQDPIQKVNDWKRQNSLRDADPPSAGEMNSSQLWNISDERNETPLVHLRGNASSRSPFPRKSEASRFSRDSETTIRQDTLTSEHKVSGEMPSTRRRSSAALSGSYAMQHTDIDDLLKDKFPTREPPVTNCKGNLVKSSSLRRDYYVDDSGDSEEENLKLIFKSWKSKDIFQRMSTEVQNLLLKSHKRLINVRMLMEVCRNKYHDRRFTDAEEKNFKGYKTGNEFLTESGIDVKKYLDDRDPFSCVSMTKLEPMRPPMYTFLMELPLSVQMSGVHKSLQAPQRLEESALQLCRFGQAQSEFGSYLDLDSTLQEQWEELEISQDQENSIVLRTKLVVRVKAIIEKLFNSTGRELRRALFSLKQIFQDDKDLVHEFVTNAGLDCLVSVGSRSDQNLQNYILRALGQIMLYVDGMAGVVEHPETLRWLYCLLTSKFRLVTKTALKLLLVFVEYADTNALVFVKAVHTYHANSPSSGRPWSHIISILNNEADGSELPIYAMTLVNRTLNAIPDQDTFYDVTDSLEEMGMQQLVQAHIHKKNCDPELVEQFQLYEAGLRYEDGEDYDFEVLPAGSKECLRQRKRTTRSQLLGTPDGLTLLSSMNTLPTSPSLALEMDGSLARKSKRYQSVENLNLNKRAFQPQIDRTVNNVSPWSRVAESGLDEAPKTADFRSLTSVRELKWDRSQSIGHVPSQNQLKESEVDLPTASDNNYVTDPMEHQQNLVVPRISEATGHAECLRSERSDFRRDIIREEDMVTSQEAAAEKFVALFNESEGVPSTTRTEYVSVNNGSQSSLISDTEFQSAAEIEHEVPHFFIIEEDLTTRDTDSTVTDAHHRKSPYASGDPNLKMLARNNCSPTMALTVDQFETVEHMIKSPTPCLGDQVFTERLQHFKDEFVIATDEEIRGKAVTVPETPPVGSLKSKIEALGKASQRPPMETSPTHAPVSPSGGVKALKEMHAAIMEKPEDSVKAPPPRERTGMIMSAKERFEASFSSKPPSAPAPASPARKDTKNGLSTGITVVTSDAESNVDVFWERCLDRVRRKPLRLRDYDFTDLEPEDQEEPRPLSSHYPRIGVPVLPSPAPIGGAIPPPVPSAIVGGIPPPPPPSTRGNALPPPPYGLSSAGPPPPPPSLGTTSSPGTQLNLPPVPGTDLPKTKKTVKLHWTEWKPSPKDLKCIANAKQTTAGRDKLDSAVDSKGIGGRFFSSVMSRSREPKEAPKDWKKCTIWSEVVQVKLDADFLQECFENKSAEVKVKKQDVGTKKIEVLDVKRSNAINIGLKVLPPPRTISTAILKMDSSIINREGIEKLLTSMLPTEEECEAILKAKAEQNGLPLGQAEQFLITLSEITYLKPRLELWLFKLDYEFIEKEIADPLADLKQGVNEVINCKTLRYVISTLLTIGNFLNGTNFRGFTLDYLARLPEVKDTKYKNSLLYHICCIVLDQFPDSTDIHSDMGAICRCHRIDWEELPEKLKKLEHDSKQAWDHYRLIFSSEKEKQKNAKLYEFLTDSMERIICLQLVYRRLMARFRHMLEYVGYSPGRASSMSVGHFCRILAEFALEYRTTREKIIEGRDKKAKARERKRTTGKLIIDVTGLRGTPNLSSQAKDDEALRGLLSKPNGETDSDASSLLGTLNRRRGNTPARRSVNRARSPSQLGEASDASMEALYPEQELLLDACWRNPSSDSLSIGSPSTPGRRQPPRERRRPAVRERHSIRRTITRKLADEEVRTLERIWRASAQSSAS